jgi:hypothetical protein
MPKKTSRFFASGVIATALALGVTAIAGAAASAATCGPQDFSQDPYVLGAQDGLWYCHYLPNGNLCMRYINGYTGVDIHYDKLRGGTIHADFCYTDVNRNVTYHDQGSFYISPGETKSFAWNNTYPTYIVGHMAVDGQGEFDTPLLTH